MNYFKNLLEKTKRKKNQCSFNSEKCDHSCKKTEKQHHL